MAVNKEAIAAKRRVVGRSDPKRDAVPLYVNEYDGEMWACNRYWLTRAERIAPLLEEYNLSPKEPGSYEVSGKVAHTSDDAPNIGAYIGERTSKTVPGWHVKVFDEPVYTLDYTGRVYALYQAADTEARLDHAELEWLMDQRTAPLADGYRYDGPSRVELYLNRHDGNVSATIVADVVHILEPSCYGTDPETHQGTYTPAVEEPAGTRVLGVMMALPKRA
jgi:hypothetical protein